MLSRLTAALERLTALYWEAPDQNIIDSPIAFLHSALSQPDYQCLSHDGTYGDCHSYSLPRLAFDSTSQRFRLTQELRNPHTAAYAGIDPDNGGLYDGNLWDDSFIDNNPLTKPSPVYATTPT